MKIYKQLTSGLRYQIYGSSVAIRVSAVGIPNRRNPNETSVVRLVSMAVSFLQASGIMPAGKKDEAR